MVLVGENITANMEWLSTKSEYFAIKESTDSFLYKRLPATIKRGGNS